MTGSAVSDKNRKGISLYLFFLLWSHRSASDNNAQSVHTDTPLNHTTPLTCSFSLSTSQQTKRETHSVG